MFLAGLPDSLFFLYGRAFSDCIYSVQWRRRGNGKREMGEVVNQFTVKTRGHQYVRTRTNVSVASLGLVRGKFCLDFVVALHHYGLILISIVG